MRRGGDVERTESERREDRADLRLLPPPLPFFLPPTPELAKTPHGFNLNLLIEQRRDCDEVVERDPREGSEGSFAQMPEDELEDVPGWDRVRFGRSLATKGWPTVRKGI